jgi:DNA-binding protein H-NS
LTAIAGVGYTAHPHNADAELEIMAINLKRLNARQLEQLSAQIEQHKKMHRQNSIAQLRAKIEAMAKAEGILIDELYPRGRGAAKSAKRKVAPKYRNPSDASQTWSGRGRQPHWYAAAIKAGKSERSLLIK